MTIRQAFSQTRPSRLPPRTGQRQIRASRGDVCAQYYRGVSRTLGELLRVLAAGGRGVDASSLMDEIESFVEEDPEGSRTAVYAYADDAGMRLRLVGFLGD